MAMAARRRDPKEEGSCLFLDGRRGNHRMVIPLPDPSFSTSRQVNTLVAASAISATHPHPDPCVPRRSGFPPRARLLRLLSTLRRLFHAPPRHQPPPSRRCREPGPPSGYENFLDTHPPVRQPDPAHLLARSPVYMLPLSSWDLRIFSTAFGSRNLAPDLHSMEDLSFF